MQDIIEKVNKTAGVRGTAIIGSGGLIIAASVADQDDNTILGGVISNLYSELSSTLKKLKKGELCRCVLSGTNGHAVLIAINENVLAVVLLRKDVNIGMVLVELKDFAKEIAEKIQL